MNEGVDARPLVSVVIPVYNVESYLRQCLDSVVHQTLQDIEIVCVNDCSLDGSLGILRQYEAKDARIKVIDKPTNEGLSVSRNVGIGVARGKYLLFIDSDDYVDTDLCRKALECAERNLADLVIYDYAGFTTEAQLLGKRSVPSTLAQIPVADRRAIVKSPHTFAWLKLVRSDLLREHNIEFPAGLTYEDVPVHWQLVIEAKTIALLPERLYFYRQRSTSITGIQMRKWPQTDILQIYDLLKSILIEKKCYQYYRDVFLYKKLNRLYGLYDSIDVSFQQQVVPLICERLGEDEWRYIFSDNDLLRPARDYYLALHGSTLAKVRLALRNCLRSCWRIIQGSAA